MPRKILGKSGESLGASYDVEGSQVAIKTLKDEEGVSLVHEMGGVQFSERLFMRILNWNTGALSASSSFYVRSTSAGWAASLPAPAASVRIYSVQAMVETSDGFNGSVTRCSILAHDEDNDNDCPIWVYNGTAEVQLNMHLAGSAVTAWDVGTRQSNIGQMSPVMLQGGSRVGQIDELVLSGTMAAFGAGTRTVHAVVLIGSTDPEGLSSVGVPIPSW